MSDLTPNDVNVNDFVYYKDPITKQELKFLVVEKVDEIFSNGFTTRLMLLDEPLRVVKMINRQDSSGFSSPHQTRLVADDAYKYRDEFDEWPTSDVILLSRCYTKQYGEVIEAVNKLLARATQEAAAEKDSLLNTSTNFKAISKTEAPAVADDYDKPFMSAERARELAERSLNVKERVALRIEDAAKSGEFDIRITDEEFKICELDLVEQGYAVCNNFVSWGDQGDWGE